MRRAALWLCATCLMVMAIRHVALSFHGFDLLAVDHWLRLISLGTLYSTLHHSPLSLFLLLATLPAASYLAWVLYPFAAVGLTNAKGRGRSPRNLGARTETDPHSRTASAPSSPTTSAAGAAARAARPEEPHSFDPKPEASGATRDPIEDKPTRSSEPRGEVANPRPSLDIDPSAIAAIRSSAASSGLDPEALEAAARAGAKADLISLIAAMTSLAASLRSPLDAPASGSRPLDAGTTPMDRAPDAIGAPPAIAEARDHATSSQDLPLQPPYRDRRTLIARISSAISPLRSVVAPYYEVRPRHRDSLLVDCLLIHAGGCIIVTVIAADRVSISAPAIDGSEILWLDGAPCQSPVRAMESLRETVRGQLPKPAHLILIEAGLLETSPPPWPIEGLPTPTRISVLNEHSSIPSLHDCVQDLVRTETQWEEQAVSLHEVTRLFVGPNGEELS